jgi:hypothetical protein
VPPVASRSEHSAEIMDAHLCFRSSDGKLPFKSRNAARSVSAR